MPKFRIPSSYPRELQSDKRSSRITIDHRELDMGQIHKDTLILASLLLEFF